MAFNLQTAIVRHILPKANQIVDTAQEDFKSVYPFQLKKMRHVDDVRTAKNTKSFQYKKQKVVNNFKPNKKTVKQHFNKKHLVYDKFNNNFDEEMFNTNIFSVQKLKNLRSNDFIINRGETQQFKIQKVQTQLIFDSRFECGNLSLASKIEDQYYLLLHNDVNTSGYTNWFYFSVKPKKPGKYNFAIMNYGKAGWPFNLGTGICCKIGNQWKRDGQNIFCQSNTKLFAQNDSFKKFNTLSFEFQFRDCEKVHFAYNIPYSYTDLLTTLDQIQKENYSYYHRKLAGTTICGNRIEMLTIANFQKHKNMSSQDLNAIVLFARAHPGQTISSWILHHFLKFLLSNNIEAKMLRDKFVFKIFPMINPDGVIHGNYRCSLIGRDLNRRWNKSIKELYPEVYYIKNQILELSQKKQIKMVIDFHGHTQKKQAFFFGCNDKKQPHRCRLFPYLLSKISKNYDFNACNFCIDKSKLSTARITLFMLLKNCDVFTLETSQFGCKNFVFYQNLVKTIGQSLVKGMFIYFKLNKIIHIYKKAEQRHNQEAQQKQKNLLQQQKNQQHQSKSTIYQNYNIEESCFQTQNLNIDADLLQKQMLQNAALLKSGNQKDDGSDSQPSVCNINFENLKKMSNRKDLKINSQINKQVKPRKNINRSLIQKKGCEINKKSIDLLPINSNNKIIPLPKRFASTSHSFRKSSQDSSGDYHNLIKTGGKFYNTKNKSQSQRGVSTPSIIRKNRKNNTQQLVKMINFELSFEGFNTHRSNTKRAFRTTNNDMINSILDVRINNFVNYTQPSLNRPYSYLYKNKK